MTATSPATAPRSDSAPDDSALLERAMRPYADKGTIYLRHAAAHRRGDQVVGVGAFSIAESCYITDTGHFNAVEFNISYNQLFYYTLAAAIRDRSIPHLVDWTLTDYWARQLPSVLISTFHSRFRRPVNSRAYRAELTIDDIEFRHRSQPLLALHTHIEFTDSGAGSASGDVEIVLVDPPAHTHPKTGRAHPKADR
ncbi:FcoT family thioesterase [Nocardia sp. CNY236]|uniref:FcoT family thioesterase n=1 Tax=Nocardia sp. CNY236 TaxID=1169152 RepID=UPI0004255927|nr:FcoT family thioesterase [Nocardia sp. CNY236]